MAKTEVCAIEGCGKKREGYNKLCSAHRSRLKRHGDVAGGGPQRNVRYKWLEEHKDHTGDGCLIWPFARDPASGYAHIHRPSGGVTTASRVMCELVNGPSPAGYEAAHNCGRGRDGCVHPGHIRWATVLENRRDKNVHGTHPKGAKNYNARFTDDQIADIRKWSQFMSQADLARMFNAKSSIISRIVLGRSYKDETP
jgi:hypothetical protein